MENGESTTLSHTIGYYVDLNEGAINNVGVFSSNCSIVHIRDGICSVNCRKKILIAKDRRRKLARETIHPRTNKRVLLKCEVVQQLAKERQTRYNTEKGRATGKASSTPYSLKWTRTITKICPKCLLTQVTRMSLRGWPVCGNNRKTFGV